MWTVGEVEAMTGVTRAMLRDYDKKGLLCPLKTGEGISNNRKLYSEDDIERLKRIVVLRAYDFSLKEIKTILDDDEADIVWLLKIKIDELKREENRLRNLILFAKFVDITDTELFEGLACGPTDIDAFADMVRDTPFYQKGMARINEYTDEEFDEVFRELVEIADDFATIGEEEGFAGVERQIERFCTWWDKRIASISECGYLGFWAIFEDDTLIPSIVEEVAGRETSGNLQMSAFYVWMKHIAIEMGSKIGEVAKHVQNDIVLAADEALEIVRAICEQMGVFSKKNVDTENTSIEPGSVKLASSVIDYLTGIIEDEELRAYLDPEGAIQLKSDELVGMRTVLSLIQPAETAEDVKACEQDASALEGQ